MCFEAGAPGDYTVETLEDCRAAIAMIPTVHPMSFRDKLHLDSSRPRPLWSRRTRERLLPLHHYHASDCYFTAPAALRAGDCLVLVNPYSGTKQTSHGSLGRNPNTWMNFWSEAAERLLGTRDPTRADQNLAFMWKLIKVEPTNWKYLRYGIGITRVPRHLPPPFRFPENEG